MWSALGTLLGAGLMAGGSVFSSILGSSSSDYAAKKSYDAQMRTNEMNYQIFRENQAWQERMANTAHQREVQDLRSAGLNPILSATGGSGAAVPSVASPSMVSPGSSVADKALIYQGMVEGLMKSANTAADVVKKISESRQLNKVTDKEVGKRHLPAYLHNVLTENGGNLGSAASQVVGIVKDLSRAAAGNFKVLKQTYFNDFRQEKSLQQQFNMTPYNAAPRIDL